MRAFIVFVLVFALIAAISGQDNRAACGSSLKALKDGCDDQKLVAIKANCDQMKEATCAKIAEYREKMKQRCVIAFKAAVKKCDDVTLSKVKQLCPKNDNMQEISCQNLVVKLN